MVIITWLVSSMLVIIYTLMEQMFDSPANSHIFLMYVFIASNIMYFTILISLVVMGIKTIMIVREERRVSSAQEVQIECHKRISKATIKMSLLLLGYVITYTPGSLSTIFFILNYLNLNYYVTCVEPFFNNVLLASSCLNIIIYVITSKRFRAAYKSQLLVFYKSLQMPFQTCWKRFLS